MDERPPSLWAASPWMAADAQVLVADLAHPTLDDHSFHHLSRVLRLRRDAQVCAYDGSGGWVSCRFDGSEELSTVGETHYVASPKPQLTVGFALVKSSKPELVVQKLTELGIDRIVPFSARRSVVRWEPSRVERQLERLRRIAVEASAQCRRLHLPSIGEEGLSEEAPLSRHAWGTSGVVIADHDGRPLRSHDNVILIGPEGGWDPDESAEFEHVSLGPTVLRAETASIAAGAQMAALRAGLLGELR